MKQVRQKNESMRTQVSHRCQQFPDYVTLFIASFYFLTMNVLYRMWKSIRWLVWLDNLKDCTDLWLMMIALLKIHLKINPTFIVFPSPNHLFLAFLSRVIPKQAIWHFRLGHLSHDRLSKIYQIYPQVFSDNKAICDVFHFVRHKKLPFSLSNSRATHKFELLHFDIWGSVSINSIHNHKYFLTVVDDYSRFVWIVILKTKSEVSSHVQQFITLIENLFQTKSSPL